MAGQDFEDGDRLYHDAYIATAQQGRRSVRSGCEVTEHSPANMTVDVDTGTVYFSTSEVSVSLQNPTITSADATFDRIDNVCVTSTGLVVVLAGTAASDPVPPDIDPDTYLVLARVSVDAAVSQINTADIKDLRTIFDLPALTSDDTRVLKTGDTMTGALTSPVVIINDGARVSDEMIGNPRVYTSETIILSLGVETVVSSQSSVYSSSDNYFRETRIKNTGDETAYIKLGTETEAPTIQTDYSLFADDEIIIYDHILDWFSAISETTTTVEITNLFAEKTNRCYDNQFRNFSENIVASGNGTFSTSFVTLTSSTPCILRDASIACNGTSDVFLKLGGGTASASDTEIETEKTKQYNNIAFTDFSFYSEATSEVRILGVGRNDI